MTEIIVNKLTEAIFIGLIPEIKKPDYNTQSGFHDLYVSIEL
ncbi:MAG: hypothetical protein Q7V19_09150 [Bacteroidales bacterium]|nr:hypothetical protein [Bacteroidales bacterium]